MPTAIRPLSRAEMHDRSNISRRCIVNHVAHATPRATADTCGAIAVATAALVFVGALVLAYAAARGIL